MTKTGFRTLVVEEEEEEEEEEEGIPMRTMRRRGSGTRRCWGLGGEWTCSRVGGWVARRRGRPVAVCFWWMMEDRWSGTMARGEAEEEEEEGEEERSRKRFRVRW